MTLSPSDSPDWTGIPGALRYLGSIDMSGSGSISKLLTFTPASYDGAIYIVASGSPNATNEYARVQVRLAGGSPVFGEWRPYLGGVYSNAPFVSFVSRALSSTWEVNAAISSAGGSDWMLYVFAAPSFPLVAQAGTTQAPLVQVLQDQARKPYDAQGFSVPASGASASVSLVAPADQRYVLDFLTFTLSTGAAGVTATSAPAVSDSSLGQLWAARMAVPATANLAAAPIVLGPHLGLVSSPGGTLTITNGPSGNAFATVGYGAYLLAGFQ